jgi:hypothetical protein
MDYDKVEVKTAHAKRSEVPNKSNFKGLFRK